VFSADPVTGQADRPGAGFCLIASGTNVEIQLFGGGESSATSLVQVAEHEGACALLLGRVYYRGDLARRLRRASLPDRSASDARWVLAAYAELGPDAYAALEGEFAIAIVDRKARRIVALRDACGGYPVYWTRGAAGIGIATRLRPLVGFTGSADVEPELLGEVLTAGYVEIDYFHKSAIRGIERLVPGTSLTADLAGSGVAIRRFWDWQQRATQPQSADLEQIGARYAELLRDSVDERARGTVAAHISGGMDSTAVAYLALDRLAASGQPLHGISIQYSTLRGLRDETPYVEAALARPGIARHRIAGDDVLDFDHLADVPLLDEPCPGLFRAGIEMALVDAAAACGAHTVLTGLGADELLSDAPFYIADLVRSGRVWRALSEAAVWGQATNSSRWTCFGSFGISPLLPASAQMGLGNWLRGGYAGARRATQWTIAPWVLPGFARQARLRERAMEHIRQNCRSTKTVVLSEALARLRYTAGDWTRNALAARHGLHIAHPFRDTRLVSFGLGVRTRVRPDPHRQKVVLSYAMRSVLPPIILDRRGKAPFNAVYFRGLSRNLPRLEAMIRSSPVDALELFDKNLMIEALRDSALGGQAMGSTSGLTNALAVVHWLTQLPQWLAAAPKPSIVRRIAVTPGDLGCGGASGGA
jgi:asparagine synthase (glutamine-hydrolysing)